MIRRAASGRLGKISVSRAERRVLESIRDPRVRGMIYRPTGRHIRDMADSDPLASTFLELPFGEDFVAIRLIAG
jgi:hypothetical protein